MDDMDAFLKQHEEEQEARAHHYVFAHRVLPQIAAKSGGAFALDLLQDHRRAAARLVELWEQIGGDLTIPLPSTGLDVVIGTCRGQPTPVIVLPTPEIMSEAHFVALVPEPQGFLARLLGRPKTWRFFTLEFGLGMGGTQRTVVCEWKLGPEGFEHANYGDGPAAEIDAFLERLQGL